MKQFITFACKAVIALTTLTVLLTNNTNAQCTAPALKFKNPTLVSGSGGNKNAVYKFANVTTGVDAYITLLDKVNGASLKTIDDVSTGYADAWQPTVDGPGSPVNTISYISWRIDFKTTAGIAYIFPCLTLSAIDIDGDNVRMREFVEVKGSLGYSINNPTTLSLTADGDSVRAMGSVTVKNGIDTSAWDTNVNFNYIGTSSIYVKTGSKVENTNKSGGSATERFHSIFFQKINVLVPAAMVLPVKFVSFNGSATNNDVMLNWNTEQEINNSHYEVERSFDMNNFTTTAMILDAYNANGSLKNYKYKDNAAELKGKTVVYYRIKQVDNNGKITYSSVIAVKLASATSGVAMQVSPNPFAEKLYVRFNATENGSAEVRVMNVTGQTIVSKQTIIVKGYNNLMVDGLTNLNKGMYVAQVVINGVVVDTQKVMKN